MYFFERSKTLAVLAITALFLSMNLASMAQQKKTTTGANPLKISWQPTQNNYEGKQQALAILTIVNTSGTTLPANGWTLYFNGGGTFAQPNNNGLTVSYVNGDLYQIKPNADFKGLPAGASVKFNLVTQGSLGSVGDAPRGFYLVWDAHPKQGIAITDYKISPDTAFLQSLSTHTQTDWATPQFVYNKNSNIQDVPADQLPRIFPTPVSFQNTSGAFVLTTQTPISADASFNKEANFLSGELANVLTKKLQVIMQTVHTPAIVLQKNNLSEGAYSLTVSPTQIVIAASTGEGISYGIQSLKNLLPPLSWKNRQASITIPGIEVKDAPRFGYRSFMLDVARNFQPKSEILKILDLMSLYKLNVFHLHFSDDEGWRVQIPSLPELTAVGGHRGHTLDNKDFLQPSYGSGPDTTTLPGSGFYTKQDFIDILKYAADRYIQVIPEIESPGHARAAVKAMEARYDRLMKEGKPTEAKKYLLTEPDDSSTYMSVQGWTDNVIDVALPSVYTFMEKVADELIAMYKEAGAPLTTIHFGGDEVPAGVWAKAPAYIQLKNADATIKSTEDLWYYYYGKLDTMLKKRGLFISGFEEMGMRSTRLDGKKYYIPNPDFADNHFQLHVWNNTIGSGSEDLAYRLANAGYKVVLACVSNQYLDLAYNASFDEPGQNWGGYVDVDKPFYFIPFDYLKNVKEDASGNPVDHFDATGKARLTDYGKSNIVGIQGLLWSENNISTDRVEYMMLPKLLGVAERAWAPNPAWATEKDTAKANELYNQAWSEFVNTLGKRELPRLSYYHNGFNYRIPTPGIKIENGSVLVNVQFPGLSIRYTTNGKEPNTSSALYTQPIHTKGRIRVAAFNAGGKHGRMAEIINP